MGFDCEIKIGQKCVQISDSTVRALRNSSSLNCHNFQMKTDMKVKICSHAKLYSRNIPLQSLIALNCGINQKQLDAILLQNLSILAKAPFKSSN